MKELGIVLAGLFIGGFLGWFAGIAWYELVEVPNAASMDTMSAASHLCEERRYLPLLVMVPGAIVGAILSAIIGVLRDSASVQGESRNQSE